MGMYQSSLPDFKTKMDQELERGLADGKIERAIQMAKRFRDGHGRGGIK